MAVAIPAFLQTKKYSAAALRALWLDAPIQSGVTAAGDLMVTWTGSGLGVQIAAGNAWIKGTTSARQGLYDLYNDATLTSAVLTNTGQANPRIDSIIMRVYDSSDGGAAQDIGAVEIITGTNTAGATLTNRNGAPGGTGGPALPASCIVLADVLLAAGATSISNATIRDRRPWARGAYFRSNPVTGATLYTTASATLGAIDATNLAPRIECSGAPLRVTLHAFTDITGGTGNPVLAARVDGTGILPGPNDWELYGTTALGVPNYEWVFTPAAGSHIIAPYWRLAGSGTAEIYGNTAQRAVVLEIEELVRQNAANNTTTSG